MARITYGGQVTEFQSGRTTPINQWSQAKGCVVGRDRKSNEINNFIEMVRIKIYQIQQEFETNYNTDKVSMFVGSTDLTEL